MSETQGNELQTLKEKLKTMNNIGEITTNIVKLTELTENQLKSLIEEKDKQIRKDILDVVENLERLNKVVESLIESGEILPELDEETSKNIAYEFSSVFKELGNVISRLSEKGISHKTWYNPKVGLFKIIFYKEKEKKEIPTIVG